MGQDRDQYNHRSKEGWCPMADANYYMDQRMQAHHARRRAKLVRSGPLFDVLVDVHLREAERHQRAADDEMAAMAREAREAGGTKRFWLAPGWAIEVCDG